MKNPVVINHKTILPFSEFAEMPMVLDQPKAKTHLGAALIPSSEGAMAGIWECTPGVFRRQVAKREFSYFLEGHCFFTPQGGAPIEICAGDSVYFPANTEGVWDVRKTIKKTYFIVD